MAFGGVQSRQMEHLVLIITLACSPGRTISTLTEMTLEEEIMEWEKWAEIKPESSAGGVSLPAEQPTCRQVLLWWGSCTDPVSAALLRCWCLSGPNTSLLCPPLSSCILFLPMGCTLHCFSPPSVQTPVNTYAELFSSLRRRTWFSFFCFFISFPLFTVSLTTYTKPQLCSI